MNSDELSQHIHGGQVMIVTQNNVARHYLKPLMAALAKFDCNVCWIPDGEEHKTVDTWQHILDQLTKHRHHRDTTLIALGGGVVGDITGFAAATYMRGVNYIQIPTTLLAQIDSSIGGKTGINSSAGKNLVGAFYKPTHTIVDINTLKTLPKREYICGFSEMVKAALIADGDFFEWLEKNTAALLEKKPAVLKVAIKKARSIKQHIVDQDEKENDIRTLLNLGHTFAHSIEAETNYSEYLHGEAVAIGLVLSARLSFQLNLIPETVVCRVSKLLQQFELPIELPDHIKYDRLLAHFDLDKKVQNKQWRFVLLKGIGNAIIAEVERDALTQRVPSTT